MNLTLKNGAILFGIIVLGVAGGLSLKELLNKARMPKITTPPAAK